MPQGAQEQELAPETAPLPEGIRALFNGEGLSGWHGLNPRWSAKLE